MHRIRWYGPTVLLLATTLVVMVAGPYVARRIVWHQTDARIRLVHDSLANNASLDELNRAFEDVSQVVAPSVVHIEVLTRRNPREERSDLFRRFPQLDRDGNGEGDGEGGVDRDQNRDDGPSNALRPFGNGSGWVWDDQGHVVTNNHVITMEDNRTPAEEIRVKFNDGTTRRAQIVQADRRSDLAVLRVEGAPLHPVMRATQPVRQGEIVFAFGSPFGNEFSMSQGIVSGMGRRLQFNNDPLSHEQYIQSDAAINPGNSGGPLVNIRGEVVGVNNAILTRTGFSNGVGYAIPIAQVERIVTQIIDNGEVARGYLGVVIDDDAKWLLAKGYEGRGVFVSSVLEGEPADDAGMRSGDVILSVEGIATPTVSALKEVVSRSSPGSQLKVEVLRKNSPVDDGETIVMMVTLARQPGSEALLSLGEAGMDDTPWAQPDVGELLRSIGLESLEDASKRSRNRRGGAPTTGIMIVDVRERSVAEAEGFRRGMTIVSVGGQPVDSIDELVAVLKFGDLRRGVILTVYNPAGRATESRLLRLE